jgi:hypothetical protein
MRRFRMKTLLSIALILIATTVFATPFLVSDPNPSGVTRYEFTGDAFFQTIASQADGSLRYDLAGIPNGNHSITVRACNELWGCSVTVPFEFNAERPNAPSNLRLVP